MNAKQMQSLFSYIKATYVDGEWLAPCPLPEDIHRSSHRLKVVLRPGYRKPIVFLCRVCGKDNSQALLDAWELSYADFGSPAAPADIEALWSEFATLTDTPSLMATHPEGKGYDRGYDVDLYDAVYNEVLDRLTLKVEDRLWLAERGIPEDVAHHLGYRSASDKVLVSRPCATLVPGFGRPDSPYQCQLRTPSILTPCRDADGKIFAIKQRMRDGGKARMRLLSSRRWGGPAAVADLHFTSSSLVSPYGGNFVYVTEGERKADCVAYRFNSKVIGVPGVGMVGRAAEVLKGYRDVPVYLAFDNDDAGQQATKKLIEKLKGIVNRVYQCTWSVKYKGVDDAIAAGVGIDYVVVDVPGHSPSPQGATPSSAVGYDSICQQLTSPRRRSDLRGVDDRFVSAAIRDGAVEMRKYRGLGQVLALPQTSEATWNEYCASLMRVTNTTGGTANG